MIIKNLNSKLFFLTKILLIYFIFSIKSFSTEINKFKDIARILLENDLKIHGLDIHKARIIAKKIN